MADQPGRKDYWELQEEYPYSGMGLLDSIQAYCGESEYDELKLVKALLRYDMPENRLLLARKKELEDEAAES